MIIRYISSVILYISIIHTPTAAQSIVINAGVSGNNTEDLLARIDKDCLSQQPDLTILMIGTNDMLNNNKYVPLKQFKKNLNKIVDLIKSAKSHVLIMNLLPVYRPYLLSRHPKGFYEPEGVWGRIKSANEIIKEVAKKKGLYFLDIHHIFDKVGRIGLDKNSLIQNVKNSGRTDGVHPTTNGYRTISVALYMLILSEKIPHKKVVCFGDSITFGFGGTTSYPTCLNSLLNY